MSRTGAAAQPATYSNTAELGQVLVHRVRVSVRARGRAAADRHRRRDLADACASARASSCRTSRSRSPVRSAGSRAHRQGGRRRGRRLRAPQSRRRSHDPAQLAARSSPGVLFAISVAGMFINRKNLILLLMCVELLLLAVNFNFVAFSRYLGDINGQIFVFFVADGGRGRVGHRPRDPGRAVPRTSQHQRRRPEHTEGLSVRTESKPAALPFRSRRCSAAIVAGLFVPRDRRAAVAHSVTHRRRRWCRCVLSLHRREPDVLPRRPCSTTRCTPGWSAMASA